jgi:hypothetical protein
MYLPAFSSRSDDTLQLDPAAFFSSLTIYASARAAHLCIATCTAGLGRCTPDMSRIGASFADEPTASYRNLISISTCSLLLLLYFPRNQ